MTNKTVYIHTLGCPKNEADSEYIAALLDERGFIPVSDPEEADIVLINTCAFVDDAKEESVEAILEACAMKEDRKELKIGVFGCLAQRYAHELKKEIPEADWFIGTGSFNDIADIISREKEGIFLGDIDTPQGEFGRLVEYDTPYAYVKISEGCEKNCTYCIIPKLKGAHRSRRMEDILEEVRFLTEEEGKSEIILVAQDTAYYGTDLYGKRMISSLIRQIAGIEGVRWIRLLYVYPEEVDDELIETYRECEKLVKYIDIPLQHINDRILRRMNRRTSSEEIRKLIGTLRSAVPGIAIRSSFITGFPGESPEEVKELCDFLREEKLTRAGVFCYSCEEGTPAAVMPDQIPQEVKEERRDMLMEAQMEVSEEILSGFVGRTLTVLIEDEEEGLYTGRSYLDSPEIDGAVYVKSDKELEFNRYYEVLITDSTEYDLWGETKE
ncbi:MAG: 30S ribosomal protein S12 methylthiotransferase RimO [Eubacteriaceae bacterium]|nr:30S ribosomal protein S12 methylthiotransferase RimO [Eubacteriaceae bacterium]